MAVRIPEETIDRIKSNANIVDVVSQYVQLKKSGKNYFGYCPFHDERTPSFSVAEEKQIFHCFSCGKGGNVFTFLMEMEGIPFTEAVRKAAEIANLEDVAISLPTEEAVSPHQSKKEELKKIHEEAATFYHQILMNTLLGESALAYLRDRGFTEQTLAEFQIGYSPPDRTATYQMLKGKGYSDSLLQETGIFSDRNEVPLLDRFSSRITFPLRDEKGRVVAFSGRILPRQQAVEPAADEKPFHEAKYLNSPETLVFTKRDFLFNFDKARKTMRSTSEVILFEGYMDVISAWQAGVKNGVASMGTSLTEEQVRLLKKVVSSLVIAYDGDRAGMDASKKAIDFLEQGRSFDLTVFPLSAGMDPDEYIRERGAEAFIQALESQRETVFQFQARYLKGKLSLDSEKNRILYLEQMLGRLARVESLLEREMYLKELAEEFGLDVEVLKRQLQDYQKEYLQTERQKRQSKENPLPAGLPAYQALPEKKRISQADASQRQLLYRLFHYEEAWLYLRETDPEFHFLREDYQTIFLLFEAYYEERGSVGNIDSFINRLTEEQLAGKVVEIELLNLNSDLVRQEIFDLVHVVKAKSTLEIKLKDKQREMREASRRQDHEEAKKLLLEIVSLSKQLKTGKK